MVNNQETRLDAIFHALSDRTRRAILSRLATGECNVTQLAEPFNMSLAAVSKHLKVLEEAGLVEKEKNGRTFCCRPQLEHLHEANLLLEQYATFWHSNLDALDKFLTSDNNNGEKQNVTGRKSSNSKASNKKGLSRKKRKSV